MFIKSVADKNFGVKQRRNKLKGMIQEEIMRECYNNLGINLRKDVNRIDQIINIINSHYQKEGLWQIKKQFILFDKNNNKISFGRIKGDYITLKESQLNEYGIEIESKEIVNLKKSKIMKCSNGQHYWPYFKCSNCPQWIWTLYNPVTKELKQDPNSKCCPNPSLSKKRFPNNGICKWCDNHNKNGIFELDFDKFYPSNYNITVPTKSIEINPTKSLEYLKENGFIKSIKPISSRRCLDGWYFNNNELIIFESKNHELTKVHPSSISQVLYYAKIILSSGIGVEKCSIIYNGVLSDGMSEAVLRLKEEGIDIELKQIKSVFKEVLNKNNKVLINCIVNNKGNGTRLSNNGEYYIEKEYSDEMPEYVKIDADIDLEEYNVINGNRFEED